MPSLATQTDCVRCGKILLDGEANVTAAEKDSFRRTPLHWAAV